MNLGLTLGGGGAKGFAHIGVLEVLEENGIKPKSVCGVSIGAVIGALYCLKGSAKDLHLIARDFIQSDSFKALGLDKFYTEDTVPLRRFKKKIFEKYYFGSLLFKLSHSRIESTRKLFFELFGNATFDDLKIPFACNALDINSGAEVVFKKGLLAEAVWATCAIPGIFPPLIKDNHVLIDGGVINNIPVEILKDYRPKTVVAVYLGGQPRFENEPDTGFRITQRALAFMRYYLDQRIIDRAEIVIKPDVSEFHWADFQALDELVARGRIAALDTLKELKRHCSFWFRFKKLMF
ncbi:MAG: patatin-like phospholipase family protein [candidate division WOR-3 bacterium]